MGLKETQFIESTLEESKDPIASQDFMNAKYKCLACEKSFLSIKVLKKHNKTMPHKELQK